MRRRRKVAWVLVFSRMEISFQKAYAPKAKVYYQRER